MSLVPEALTDLVATQRNRPLSVAVTAFALFLPASLTIFLSDPVLFTTLGLNGVILLAIAVSLPIVMLCFGIWYTPLTALLKTQHLVQGRETQDQDVAQAVNKEDPLEWPCLLTGSWTATLVLYGIAALSYAHPLRVGATYLLTSAILLGLWLVLFIASAIFSIWVRRKWTAMIQRAHPAVGKQ